MTLDSLSVRRERDPYTRAFSIVVSRGFGFTVTVSLVWWSFTYHRGDRELERLLENVVGRPREHHRRLRGGR